MFIVYTVKSFPRDKKLYLNGSEEKDCFSCFGIGTREKFFGIARCYRRQQVISVSGKVLTLFRVLGFPYIIEPRIRPYGVTIKAGVLTVESDRFKFSDLKFA